jgi:peptidoglycan/LPS O-acetylase OafA/YrhL
VRSNNREYLPAVDHLRFGAAALVVMYHTIHNLRPDTGPEPGKQPDWVYSNNPVATFLIEGHSGVALFMVLSGFILTTGSLGRDIDYRSFVRNRLLRVGPLYLVVLLLALATAGEHFSLWAAIQTTLGFGRMPGGFTAGAFAVVLWAVGVEVQFYLLFPFFLRLLNGRGPRPLLQFILLMMVMRVLAALSAVSGSNWNYDHLTFFSLVGRIDQFLIGMLAAYFFPQIRGLIGRAWIAVLALGVTVGALFVYNVLHGHAGPGHLWRTVWVDVEALVWAGLLVSYVGTVRFGRGRLSKVLAWAGERSYGLYLLHVPFIYVVMFRGWRLDVPGGPIVDATATGLVLILPCAVLLSALTFSAVERPFLSLRRRYVGGQALTPSPKPRSPEQDSPGRPPAELDEGPVTERLSRQHSFDVHQRGAERLRV